MDKQQEYNKRWAEENKEHNRKLKYRSTARTFIRNHADLNDLKELREMANEKETALKIKEIHFWLKDFGAVKEYSPFKQEPTIIEKAQPLEFVSFYYSTLEEEKESLDFEGSYEELAESLNLDDVKPEETFVQLNVIDWSDTTNATIFYLSEVSNKEDLMAFVNETLELDQVTHSSGLKPKYQFIEKEGIEMENLKLENLMVVHTNEDGANDLEFQFDDKKVFVRNAKVYSNAAPDSQEYEDYWDDTANVDRAVSEASSDDIEKE